MELPKIALRAMMFYDYKKGLTFTQCFESLNKCFPGSTQSKETVRRWFQEFQCGRVNLEDEARSGRPRTAVTEENVVAVKNLIKEDPHITYCEIEEVLKIASTSVNTILHECLHVQKRFACWVPHLITEGQKRQRVEWCEFMIRKYRGGESKDTYDIITGDETWIYCYNPELDQQSRVWCFESELPPTKTRRPRGVGKRMVASFFSKTGHIATIEVDDRPTEDSDWYVNHCLPKVFAEWRKKHPKSSMQRLRLHHDNASPHKSGLTAEFLSTEGVRELPHPPYSPDLSPCDFYLFPVVKNKLRGKRFQSPDEAVAAYLEIINGISKDSWSEAFASWFKRMEKCKLHKGDYFEHLQ